MVVIFRCSVLWWSFITIVSSTLTESEIFLIWSAQILGVRTLEQVSIVWWHLILVALQCGMCFKWTPVLDFVYRFLFYFYSVCLFGGKLYLYSTQISSVEYLYAITCDDVYAITEYTKNTRNVYVGVPGIHHYAINIPWTMCVFDSKLSQVVMLHSCVWKVPGLNLGTNFPGWSLLYSCCHSRQIPVFYFRLG